MSIFTKRLAYLYTDTNEVIVRELLGKRAYDFTFIKTETDRLVVLCDATSEHRIQWLEKLAEDLGEGMAVNQDRFDEPRLVSLTSTGQLHVAHHKNHDSHVFHLTDDAFYLSMGRGHEITRINKIVMVGEGNGLRNVRRLVKRYISDKTKDFTRTELAEIQKRIRYNVEVLFVLENGFVLSLRNMEVLQRCGPAASELEVKYYGFKQQLVASGILSVANRDPIDVVLEYLDFLDQSGGEEPSE